MWKNNKKKIKHKFRDAGYPIPSSAQCKLLFDYFKGQPMTVEAAIEVLNMTGDYSFKVCRPEGSLAPLQPATCTGISMADAIRYISPFPVSTELHPAEFYGVQEGNNPMFTSPMPKGDLTIQLSPAATASVQTKSDVAIQRDYLMSQFKDISRSFDAYYGAINQKLRKTFNLDVNNAPKTAQELIDAIKGDKFKLDDRIAKLVAAGEEWDEAEDESLLGPFAGITWDGPMPDRNGFDAAQATFKDMLRDTERTIIVKDPDAGLAAIQALEAWTPTGKAS